MEPRGDPLFTGWRKAGVINTALLWVMAITVAILLLSSAWRPGSDRSSIFGTTVISRGDCNRVSRINLVLHGVVNGIAILVLASSNFFMQVLCSPTRADIDRAHSKNHYLEIGAQSVKNLFFLPKVKSVLWLLLAVTSVPLHLYFNACLTDSKASTDAYLVIATQAFLTRSVPFFYPGAGHRVNHTTIAGTNPWGYLDETLLSDLTRNAMQWEPMDLKRCLATYNDPGNPLTLYRNVVMVVRNKGENETAGWNMSAIRSEFYIWPTKLNSLWKVEVFNRTHAYGVQRQQILSGIASFRSVNHSRARERGDWLQYQIGLDVSTGTIPLDPNDLFRPDQPPLEIMHCLAEPFITNRACELRVQNTSLLVVSVFCLVKAVVCLTAILLLRHDNPLLTPGDAIESFISKPDPITEHMCWASRRPDPQKKWWQLRHEDPRQPWNRGPRQWKTIQWRLGAAVPWYIWAFTFGISLALIAIGINNVVTWWDTQPWSISVFGPSPSNGNVELKGWEKTYMGTAFKINNCQLGISIAYLAYNGLFTRMLSEREWASFRAEFNVLRVSRPRGAQRSTYRLQLPYRWSIPLILASGTLHWLVSNCVYPQSYISYSPLPPYNFVEFPSDYGMGLSVKANIAALIFGVLMLAAPIILSRVKLPGDMVIAANNSVVISAACHSVPETNSGKEKTTDRNMTGPRGSISDDPTNKTRATVDVRGQLIEGSGDTLVDMPTQRLKWGVVSRGPNNTRDEPGHLSFGVESQDVGAPVDGDWYA